MSVTITNDDLLDYLEHHGVKGQKWGIRRDRKTGVRPIARTYSRSRAGKASVASARFHTPEAKATRQRGAAITLGAIAVLVILHHLGKMAADEMNSSSFKGYQYARQNASGSHRSTRQSGARTAEQVIRENKDVQMSSLKRMYDEGKMTKEQYQAFSAKMSARYERKAADQAKGKFSAY